MAIHWRAVLVCQGGNEGYLIFTVAIIEIYNEAIADLLYEVRTFAFPYPRALTWPLGIS